MPHRAKCGGGNGASDDTEVTLRAVMNDLHVWHRTSGKIKISPWLSFSCLDGPLLH